MFLKIKTIIFENLVNSKDSRSLRMNKNILTMIIVRGASVLISLLYVPLFLKSIDRVDYGILITLTSMVAWIGMLDIGFGNGLRNKLTIAISNNNLLTAKRLVSSAYAAISLYMVGIIIIFLSVSHYFSWSSILNVDVSREDELYTLVNVVFVLFGFNFILGVLNSIIFSVQKPALQSVIGLIIQVVSFMIIFAAIKGFSITSILTIGIINSVISPLILFGSSIYLFSTKFKSFSPTWKMVDVKTIKEILILGSKFFILQVITIVLFSINNVLILHISGPEAVVKYNIAFRYIDIIAIIFTIFITPVWSASTDAFANNDIHWIRLTVRKMLIIASLIVFGGVLMIFIAPIVFKIWLGEGVVEISNSTLLLVLLFVTFRMLYQCYGFVINGSGKLKAQMTITFALALLYIPSALMLGSVVGFYGVLIVSAITQLGNFIWSKQQFKHIINNTGNRFWHE